jgi:hypothetical protein
MTDEEKSLERNAAIILAGIAAAPPHSNTFKMAINEQVKVALEAARYLRASFMEKK